MVRCRNCRELITPQASVCRYCGAQQVNTGQLALLSILLCMAVAACMWLSSAGLLSRAISTFQGQPPAAVRHQ